VLEQSPEFFERTPSGEVLSRLTTDTTLVQTVVGSSLSMGLRNGVMGVGALLMLIWTNPWVMVQVIGVLALIVIPTVRFGRRVRKLSRASQDRVADSSAIAAEVLNAIPVVQSYSAEGREAQRFARATEQAFDTAVKRTRARSVLVAFIIMASSAALLWGLYQGTQSVMRGEITAGHLGQTVMYIIILAGAFAVLGEVYGDLLRAAGATERLMELLATRSSIASPAQPLTPPLPAAGSAVHFEAIDFHYPSRPSQPALSGFELQVEPGETVALVGPSGAGKTTVFSLLLRFYEPQSGCILLDGTPIAQLSLQGLRDRIALGAPGKVISAFDIARAMALGADWCNSARGFMFALGCIQAQTCHTGQCPTGVTTQDPLRQRGLVVLDKASRVYNFHHETLKALRELVQAAGLQHPRDITADHIVRRVNDHEVHLMSKLLPEMTAGALLNNAEQQDSVFRAYWDRCNSNSFALHSAANQATLSSIRTTL
jgi:ABC-type bacteriocin/lantibiotic exporter with double-glycine peptidase domain